MGVPNSLRRSSTVRTSPIKSHFPSLLCLPLLSALGCGTFTIELEDSQNYYFETTMDAGSTQVPNCETSPVDWSNLTEDLQGHELDPTTDVDTLRLVRFGELTQEEVLRKLADNTLPQFEITGYVDYEPTGGETSCEIADFDFVGTPIPYETEFCEGWGTYLLSALTGLYEYRMFTFVEPTKGAPETTIYLDNDSGSLEFFPDLGAGSTIPVDKAKAYEVNWMGLTTDGQGNELELSNIDQLMLARYSLSTSELEDQFFNLLTIGEEIYEADVEGLGEFALEEAVDADGKAFAGFEESGTWILALRCSTCPNPAPLFLGVLEPEE